MARKPVPVDDAPAEAVAAPTPSNIVTNPHKGTTLHLGDGRRLAFGESAEVSPELAGFLRERGQVA